MGNDIIESASKKINHAVANAVEIDARVGGILITNMGELVEFARVLAGAEKMIRKHLRNNVGGCLAITLQAIEWRMSPISVANKSYEVNDQIAYESQLIHAVIEARAPLQRRLRARYEGEGATRKITIIGYLIGEDEPFEYTSPTVGNIKTKNSPLWTADPDQQLWYFGTRSWARRYCPDVILGLYSEDEIREAAAAELATDITPPKPQIGERLRTRKPKAEKTEGFAQEHVEKESEAASPPSPGAGEPGGAAAGSEARPPSETASEAGPAPEAQAAAENGDSAAGPVAPDTPAEVVQPQPPAAEYPPAPVGVHADWWSDQMRAALKATSVTALERVEADLEAALADDQSSLKIALKFTAGLAKAIMERGNKGKKR